jgi:hypothetical protein
LPLRGSASTQCPETGELYVLRDDICTIEEGG